MSPHLGERSHLTVRSSRCVISEDGCCIVLAVRSRKFAAGFRRGAPFRQAAPDDCIRQRRASDPTSTFGDEVLLARSAPRGAFDPSDYADPGHVTTPLLNGDGA